VCGDSSPLSPGTPEKNGPESVVALPGTKVMA
jgi:hypothetical protein